MEHFHGKFSPAFEKKLLKDETMNQCIELMEMASTRVKQVSVLMVESILHFGIASKKEDILKSQLEKITGDDHMNKEVSSVLLQKARAIVKPS